MATTRHHLNPGGVPRLCAAAAAVALALLAVTSQSSSVRSTSPPEGFVTTIFRPQEPGAIEAAFARESYRPGQHARLHVWSRVRQATIRIFRAGPETDRTVGYNEMRGVPVTPPRAVDSVRPGRVVSVSIGSWPSGLYFARLDAAGQKRG